MFICMEKSTLSLPSLLRYCNDITNLLFWVLRACQAMTSKNDTTGLEKTLIFIFMQKIIFIPNLFLELLQTYYKLVILGTLSMRDHAYQKQSLGFFTDINYTLKNPKIWLTKNILGNNSRTRILPDMGFAIESQESKELSFALFFRKNKLFKKIQNTLFLGPFSSKFE